MSTNGGAVGIASASQDVTDSTIHYIDKDTKSASTEPSINVEKGEVVTVEPEEEDTLLLSHEEQFPIDPNADLETQQFTVRAVLVGCILGGVIAASKYTVKPSMVAYIC